MSSWTTAEHASRIEPLDSGSADDTPIPIERLPEVTTLVQISDGHLTDVDARDP